MIFITEEQCEHMMQLGYKQDMLKNAGNADYIYSAEHLSMLPGRDNQKKRNRVNKFIKTYPNITIRFSTCYDRKICKDIIEIEEKWLLQYDNIDASMEFERDEIYEACKLFDELGLMAAVVYDSYGVPIAMSIASLISEGCFDIHFEKCFGEYMDAGGYAYINQQFAKYLKDNHNAKWLNREEDIGVSGLRTAKSRYHPDLLVEKYHCKFDGKR